jgi:hypothetical protein
MVSFPAILDPLRYSECDSPIGIVGRLRTPMPHHQAGPHPAVQ